MDPKDSDSQSSSNEPTCRICLEATCDGGGPLITPCGCTGTAAHVHTSCLTHWLQVSGHNHCEVCHQELSVTRRPPTCGDGLTVAFRICTGLAWQEMVSTVIAIFCLVISIFLTYKFWHPTDWSAKIGLLLGLSFSFVSLFFCFVTWFTFVRANGRRVLAMWRGRRTEGVQVDIEMVEMGN